MLDRAGAYLSSLDLQSVRGRQTGDSAADSAASEKHVANTSTVSVALKYLAHGWAVVPMILAEKKPHIRWAHLQDRLPTEDEVSEWFGRWPQAGVALVLGPVSGVFVIDVDGEEGHTALLKRLGNEPRAPKVISGSRAPYRYHLYFACPNIPTRGRLTPWHPQLEFRGKGGIVVLPPSLHKSGHCYEWARGRAPGAQGLPEVPEKVLRALQPLQPTAPQKPATHHKNKKVNGIDASQRTLDFLSARWAEGPGWNNRLYAAACDLHGRDMPIEEAEPLLLAGARPWTRGDEELARRTIKSAFSTAKVPARC